MPLPPRAGRRVSAGAAVLAAATVGALLLSTSGEEPPPARARDLGTPRDAAHAFRAAALARDGAGLLELTCVAHPDCVRRQGQVPADQVERAKQAIRDSVDQLAGLLGGAEFGEVSEASMPGAVEVDYTVAGAAAGQRQALVFIELDGDWLYLGSVGAAG